MGWWGPLRREHEEQAENEAKEEALFKVKQRGGGWEMGFKEEDIQALYGVRLEPAYSHPPLLFLKSLM